MLECWNYPKEPPGVEISGRTSIDLHILYKDSTDIFIPKTLPLDLFYYPFQQVFDDIYTNDYEF